MTYEERPARAVIDLTAIAANTAALRRAAGGAGVMAVVKADGYGHGMVPTALAALAGGATWLGTAHPDEALELRAAGITAQHARILTWLYPPTADLAALISADVDLSISLPEVLERSAATARTLGTTARVHLKVDTGLGRNGLMPAVLPEVAARAAVLQAAGDLQVVGLWSHLACADEPHHPSVTAQQQVFEAATATLAAAGIVSEVRHLANTAATLDRPDLRYDLVRPGLGLYGLSPLPGRDPAEFGLRPAMTLQADLATVKDVPAGHGVSYGHLYRTTTDTKLGIVPLGYADGIPRHASGGTAGPGGPVQAGRRICRVAGRVCMDQFVLDLGADTPLRPGDTVTLFGPGPGRIPGSQDDGNGDDGGGLPPAPTAEDWAQAAGTIAYEIVTRVGPRLPRRHEGVAELAAQAPGLPWTAVAA